MPVRYHHGDLRAALLDRAEQTIREKGLAALSLRELARDLGVSNAAPSRHFKDKQALLDAVALAGFERLLALQAAAQRSGRPFAARMRGQAYVYVDFAVANTELLDIMYTAKHDSAASAELIAAGHRVIGTLLALIAEGQRIGEVRQGPAERIGLPLMAAVHGYASLVSSGLLPAELAGTGLDDVIDPLLRSLRPD
ncbi:MAG TPA: TetR/AcrR family transcriptional regulator [Pseudonocardiaceae bacterium]|nr:TetR/AcrR family transcriptional regulator [Pseudonocardiaceae bacterium]